MLIYSTPCARVEYKEEGNILLIKWNQKPDSDQFKNVYSRVLELAEKEYPTTLFCTDMSACGSLSTEQECWLNEEYYLQVYNSLKDNIYAAILFSEDHFKAIISNYKELEADSLHAFMHFNYFTKTNEAFQWLSSIKKGQDVSYVYE